MNEMEPRPFDFQNPKKRAEKEKKPVAKKFYFK